MVFLIGDKIKNTRKSLGITQNELSRDICTQSQISKIEKNEIIPSSEILFQISKKLNVSMDFFFDYEDKVNSKIRGKKICEDYLLKREYRVLLDFVSCQYTASLSDLEIKYYTWIKVVCIGYVKNDYTYCIDALNNIIEEYKHVEDYELNANIFNSLSNFYFKKNEVDLAQENLFKAMSIITTYNVTGNIQNKVYYNVSRQLYMREKYTESLNYANLGIEKAIANDNNTILEYLIYIHSLCIVELEEITEHDIDLYITGMTICKLKYDIDLLNLYKKELKKLKENRYEKDI